MKNKKCISCKKKLGQNNNSGYCTKCYVKSPKMLEYQRKKQKEFYHNKSGKDKKKLYRRLNKEHIKKYQKKYQRKNIVHIRELKRIWEKKHKEERRRYHQKREKQHKLCKVITKHKKPCDRKALINGLCTMHYIMLKKKNMKGK